MGKRQKGFTLTEILVVIGIIAVLTGILLPVLQAVRKRSHEATCLSNLSQIGKGILMYASDYDDHLVFAPDSYNKEVVEKEGRSPYSDSRLTTLARALPPVHLAIKPYTTNLEIWRCPLDFIDDSTRTQHKYPDTWFELCGSSYTYFDFDALVGKTLGEYKKTAEMPLVFDHSNHSGSGATSISNVLFADMHAKATTGGAFAQYMTNHFSEE